MKIYQEIVEAKIKKQILTARIVSNIKIDLDADALPNEVLTGKTFYNTTVKEKRTGTMPIYDGAVEIEPSIVEQTIETAGKFNANNIVAKAVTSAIDSNIVSENIKKDITILGVTGKNTVVDTEETVSPMVTSDLLKDKVGFVNGSKVTGTLDIDNINVILEFLQGNINELEDDEILQILQGNYIYIEE